MPPRRPCPQRPLCMRPCRRPDFTETCAHIAFEQHTERPAMCCHASHIHFKPVERLWQQVQVALKTESWVVKHGTQKKKGQQNSSKLKAKMLCLAVTEAKNDKAYCYIQV